MKNSSTTTNIILIVIAIILLAVFFVIINKKPVATPIAQNPDPAHTFAEKDVDPLKTETVEKSSSTGADKDFVHPPAEGKFVTDAVKNFTATYNKITRTFSISAVVSTSFTFEANLPYKVYDSKGGLIATGHTQVYGHDSQSQYDTHLPTDLQFIIPDTIKENEILVFRFLADNASGLPEHDKYWGTTIRVN